MYLFQYIYIYYSRHSQNLQGKPIIPTHRNPLSQIANTLSRQASLLWFSNIHIDFLNIFASKPPSNFGRLPPGCIPATPQTSQRRNLRSFAHFEVRMVGDLEDFSPKCGCLLVTNGFFFGKPCKMGWLYVLYILYIYIYGIAKKVWRKFDRWWIAKSLDCCRIIELLHVWSQFLEGK